MGRTIFKKEIVQIGLEMMSIIAIIERETSFFVLCI